ncbi:hypothetical protein EC950183_4866, partial [Escherichia coli 95.0183]
CSAAVIRRRSRKCRTTSRRY